MFTLLKETVGVQGDDNEETQVFMREWSFVVIMEKWSKWNFNHSNPLIVENYHYLEYHLYKLPFLPVHKLFMIVHSAFANSHLLK